MPLSTDRPFVPWLPPSEPGAALRESCTMQAMIAGGAGGVFGLALGAVLAPFNSSVSTLEDSNLPMREQFRRGMKEIGTQSRSWGKSLMVIGAVFSCSECFVEKTRGRTDRWNPIIGGCITGGALAVNGAHAPRPSRCPMPHIAPPVPRAIPSSLTHPAARHVPVLRNSWAAGDGDRLRWFRRLLCCDRRDRLRGPLTGGAHRDMFEVHMTLCLQIAGRGVM